jgi:hypothetical protein
LVLQKEIQEDLKCDDSTIYIDCFLPPNYLIKPGVEKVYAGMIAAVQVALDKKDFRVSSIECYLLFVRTFWMNGQVWRLIICWS